MEPNRTLSHYRLIEKIGEGGMGVVWKAEDTVLGRTVAVKVLPADLARDEKRRQMFLDEARLASSLSEAHIVQVFEFGREGDLDFIVMEYVEGKPLSQILKGRSLTPDRIAEIGHQVARALARAHRKGLLHRDLKPSNILITPEGDAKVVDFGLAALFTRGESTFGGDSRELSELETRSGSEKSGERRIAGTLPYMSPEQVRGEELDARSDIFSLGVVLYEMTTGHRPFIGATSLDVAQRIQEARPKPVHEVVPDVPLDLDRSIHKALAPRRGERYQTMDDLAVDLRRLAKELESGSSPSYEDFARLQAPPRRSWRVLASVVGVVLIVASALGAWWLEARSVSRLDDRTILVLPFRATGQQAADYLGQACAEAIAVNLAQYTELKIPAVPQGPLGSDVTQPARKAGAGRVLTGTIAREGNTVRASLQMLEGADNRILWGTQAVVMETELGSLAASLASGVAEELRVVRQHTYDYVWYLTGSPAMAGSPELARVWGAIRRNEVDEAVPASEQLLRRFPGEPDAYFYRSFALYGLWYWKPSLAARLALEQSLPELDRAFPGGPYAEIFRAILVGEGEGRYEKEVWRLSQLLQRKDLSPRLRAWILRNRGKALSLLWDSENAIRDLEEAIRLDPLNWWGYNTLGKALVNVGRFDEAAARCQEALSLEPSNDESSYRMGIALYYLGNTTQAVEHFRRVCDSKKDQMSCAFLASGLHRLNQKSKALEAADLAAKLPDNTEGNFQLARYWSRAGDANRALRFLANSGEFRSSPQLSDDPDFASLHGNPEFEAIVTEVKKRLADGKK